MTPGWPTALAVARYLRPEEAVVPFRDRSELGELLRWCTSLGPVGVRLVTGDGGAGKTRLALRLGKELGAAGWQQLWVPRGAEDEAIGAVRTLGQPCVLIVDYAETRPALAGLIDDMASERHSPKVRLVLLARSAGEWWQQLLANAERQAAALLEVYPPITLGPMNEAGGPQEVFAEALTAFADKLGISRPEVKLALPHSNPVVLVVHAAALLAVATVVGSGPPEPTISAGVALEGLLKHETRYWAWSAKARGLDLDVSVLRLAVALTCLLGADSQTDAVALLARIPDLDSAERRGRVARWLHDLYPAPPHEGHLRGGDWLGSLRPDRLAELLVANELSGHAELVGPWFTGLNEVRAARALTVVARAAQTQQRAIPLLHTALQADIDRLAVPALGVAMETNPVVGGLLAQVLSELPVSRETLRCVADQSPHPSLALAKPAAVALQLLAQDSMPVSAQLLAGLRDRGSGVSLYARLLDSNSIIEHARTLKGLSDRLAEIGRREEALAAIEQAVTIHHQLAEALPEVLLPERASALNDMSVHLRDLGRKTRPRRQSRVVAIRRVLAEARPKCSCPTWLWRSETTLPPSQTWDGGRRP